MDDDKKKEKMPIIWGVGIFLCILLFLISLFIGIKSFNKDENTNINNNNDDIIYNENEDVIGDKKLGNVSFTNIECSFDGFNSLLTYTITNNGKDSIILSDYELIVKDKDNNILAIMVPGDTSELKSKESLDIGNAIDINLTKASKLELNKTK